MKRVPYILSKLKSYERFSQLYNREVRIPTILDNYQVFGERWFPHPPMLLPVFIDNSSFILTGVSIHPFSKRKSSILSYDLETDYMLEKARSEEQFITKMIMEMDMIEEEITAEMSVFCKQINFNQAKEVDEHCEIYGDDPNYMEKLINFDRDLPLTYCKNIEQYDGEYISSEKLFNESLVWKASLFEISNQGWLKDVKKIPEWLRSDTNKLELLDRYVDEGDFSSAWLVVNSMGLNLKDIALGLISIKSKVNDPFFELVAEQWLEGYNS